MNKLNLFIALSILLLWGCNQGGSDGKKIIDETPTRGNIQIAADESFQKLIEQEIEVFQHNYKYAKINAAYETENDLFSDFFKDSVRLIITTRKLTTAEENGLKSNSIFPKTTKIAYDALAFIVNKDNPDTLIKFETIKDIFSGNVSDWAQINKKSKLKDIKVVFDNNKSGNVRYIIDRFMLSPKFPEYCYAVNSNPEVISFVEKNKGDIGIVSVNWINNKEDTVTQKFLQNINIVAVGSTTEGNVYLKPYLGYIAEKSYPFVRDVYIISRELFTGLGSGFVAWVASDVGQRIVLRSGMVPATMPIRLVKVSKE
ncbi:MAG: substrate-binding domain-containing protein [Bacteroidia bacterium]|nr:substrate-binding domain-containing protein [Bacteroidia bacterium]